MAQQRVKAKSDRQSRSSGGARDRQSKTNSASGTADEAIAQIKRERDQALGDLAAAKKRIAELESQHEQVVNRIDWVIDSLHMMKDEAV